VYQLDINKTMRYDRIYLGACANSRSKYLYRLLEVGGILVGPFQSGRHQQLRRVIRRTETQFSVEVLESVRFASLIEPLPTSLALSSSETPPPTSLPSPVQLPVAFPALPAGASTPTSSTTEEWQQVGLPGVPFTFALSERPWTPSRASLYPPSLKTAVPILQRGRLRDTSSCFLPREIWIQHVFPWCSKWWFAVPNKTPNPVLHPASLSWDMETTSKVDEGWVPSDDGGSTRAPSAQTTPESRPDHPPAGLEMEEPLDLGNVFVEVFDNGVQHAIGTEGDPDDRDPDFRSRAALPMQVLQLLSAAAWRPHSSRREHANDEDSEEEDDYVEMDEDADDGEEQLEHNAEHGRGGDDEEMMDAELDSAESR